MALALRGKNNPGDISYEQYVYPYIDDFIKITVPKKITDNVTYLAKSIIDTEDYFPQNKADLKSDFKRFYLGLLGQAACEIYLSIPIIDWIAGESVRFNAPMRNYHVGTKTALFGEYPIVLQHNRYPQIICLALSTNEVYLCGIAPLRSLNIFQCDDLIIKPDRTWRASTGFYGFHSLISLKYVDLNEVEKDEWPASSNK